MTFGRWYPLSNAVERAPAGPGVLQLRVAEGLIEYPRGKSAMVHYALADDMARVAAELRERFGARELLCRHSEEVSLREAENLGGVFDTLLQRFRVRFGSEPRLPG